MLPVFYLLPLFLIAITSGSLIKSNGFRLMLLLLFNVIIISELISIYFSGGLVDYQFYVNLNLSDIVSGLLIFKYQALLSIGCFFIILFTCYKLATFLHRRFARKYALTCLAVLLWIICYNNGPVNRAYEIVEVIHAQPLPFDEALQNVYIDPNAYPTRRELTANAGKNIIVISMESLEQNFLNPPFSALTPNLTKLSRELTYFTDMPMAPGSSWTLASLYTYMTGVPLLVGGYNTSLFKNKHSSELVSLGDILAKAGYEMRYVMSDPEFADMGHAVNLFRITVISEKTYPNRYPPAPFGLYDRDILDLAKHELKQLVRQPKPFALFVSTISTHAPNGFYDRRMETFIKPQSSDLEFAVASLDYNLGLFIDYLRDNQLLDNTVIYLFPDHLMMGYGTQVISKLSEQPRKLYLMTNAVEKVLGKLPDQTIYQIDLPRLIINGAEIQTNAKFLADFIPDNEKFAFINDHKSDIAALNRSSLSSSPP